MRDEAGFSLLETIAAFTIAAMTMAALMELLSHDAEGVRGIANYARAVELAESRLDGLGLTAPLVAGRTGGRFDGRFHWQQVVEPVPGTVVGARRDLPAIRPYRVRITVFWPDGGTAKSVSLDTVRLGPSS